MRKLISFMHISLDGFVAGPNGEMDWIKVNEEIFTHVGKRISQGDTALYGRVTYQMMENYWPDAGKKPSASQHDIEHSKWYNDVFKVVLSQTMKDADLPRTKIISEDISSEIEKIKHRDTVSDADILVFGSPTATHSLMKLDLIDGYWLFVNPVILGKGIPLFNGIDQKQKLQLVSTHQFICGVTELNYYRDKG